MTVPGDHYRTAEAEGGRHWDQVPGHDHALQRLVGPAGRQTEVFEHMGFASALDFLPSDRLGLGLGMFSTEQRLRVRRLTLRSHGVVTTVLGKVRRSGVVCASREGR